MSSSSSCRQVLHLPVHTAVAADVRQEMSSNWHRFPRTNEQSLVCFVPARPPMRRPAGIDLPAPTQHQMITLSLTTKNVPLQVTRIQTQKAF